MIGKSLIAAAAIATTMAVALPATQAEAKTNIDINIGFGVGGGYYGGGYYGGGYYNPGYPVYSPGYISCKKGRNIVDNSGFNKVNAIDCSLPTYKYTAWKKGHKFVVSVNRYGNIYKVNKIF